MVPSNVIPFSQNQSQPLHMPLWILAMRAPPLYSSRGCRVKWSDSKEYDATLVLAGKSFIT